MALDSVENSSPWESKERLLNRSIKNSHFNNIWKKRYPQPNLFNTRLTLASGTETRTRIAWIGQTGDGACGEEGKNGSDIAASRRRIVEVDPVSSFPAMSTEFLVSVSYRIFDFGFRFDIDIGFGFDNLLCRYR
ncbi:hypothetical protein CAPTEDRAFT_206060 [Capitella teleta]|uniref:Uncharacterized protein n=1 Tax=Capitella teleta TaxID=283909 RepID=R7UQR7_CAPTE|nr:hypothetical protein CAPTEDRAFT_206060 [Capitella teleta]|eukprot:ELU08874.1 hypothetical protein CAPTEDRAFT_206060 [Capitella teleta]